MVLYHPGIALVTLVKGSPIRVAALHYLSSRNQVEACARGGGNRRGVQGTVAETIW